MRKVVKFVITHKTHCDTTYQRKKGLTMHCYKHFDLNRSLKSVHIY
jgi:hypothetical protein